MTEKPYAVYLAEGWFVPGVPARNLSKEEWDGLTDKQREMCKDLYAVQEPKRKSKEEVKSDDSDS